MSYTNDVLLSKVSGVERHDIVGYSRILKAHLAGNVTTKKLFQDFMLWKFLFLDNFGLVDIHQYSVIYSKSFEPKRFKIDCFKITLVLPMEVFENTYSLKMEKHK